MKINIFELIEGAKQAEGLTVIIDVFRAFTLEACLFARGAGKIYPIGEMDAAFALKNEHPDWLLFGERGGAKVAGCDFGNSPSAIEKMDFSGQTLIHSTSAGTQGIVNASGADEIITGSLVNARAIAHYIREKNPDVVSLVAMGNAGVRRANEDVLCAEYIRSILANAPLSGSPVYDELTNMVLPADAERTPGLTDIEAAAANLRFNGGDHFFNEKRQHIYPMADFYCSTRIDLYDFVIKVGRDDEGRLVCARV